MADARKVIKRVRRVGKQPKTFDPVDLIIAENRARKEKREMWEQDKVIVRDNNFKKALIALEVKHGEEMQEKERQAVIAQTRLDNLKKARRKLKRLRNGR
jgi:hypothetical protein